MNKGFTIIEVIMLISIIVAVFIMTASVLDTEAYEAKRYEPQTIKRSKAIVTKAKAEEDGRKEDADDLLIARVVQAEAGTEPFVGQVAVATTIINRAECRGMTISEVVYEKNQFATPAVGIITNECKEAVAFARANRDLFPHNMVYFRRDFYHTFGTNYTVIGHHYFSTEEDYE